jgi:uncharacterized membrane protein YphA (DoxX/SURF4 family)
MSGFSPISPPSKPSAESPIWLRFAHSSLVEILCRYLLAAVFLSAAATKLLDLPRFADLLILHSVLPVSVAPLVAVFVPWLEMTCGFCLLLNVARREAAVILGGLLLVFTVYVLMQPAQADCGCFFVARNLPVTDSRWWPVVRNLFLLACAGRVAWRVNKMSIQPIQQETT